MNWDRVCYYKKKKKSRASVYLQKQRDVTFTFSQIQLLKQLEIASLLKKNNETYLGTRLSRWVVISCSLSSTSHFKPVKDTLFLSNLHSTNKDSFSSALCRAKNSWSCAAAFIKWSWLKNFLADEYKPRKSFKVVLHFLRNSSSDKSRPWTIRNIINIKTLLMSKM